jgi:RimJ/RimL family protein N-acetyltransferase
MGIADGGAEVGYWTAPWGRGRGATAEAVGAVCRWGFGALGLQRVLWRAGVGNWGSRAVAERCGFTVEGRLRLADVRRDGTRGDDWYGSLLATDEVRDRRAFGSWRDRSGDGLVMRRWRDDEADAAALLEGCSDAETARWVPVPVPFTGARPPAGTWRRVPAAVGRGRRGAAGRRAGRPGGGGAVLMAPTGRSHPEVGWWTMPAARRQWWRPGWRACWPQWATSSATPAWRLVVDVDNPGSSRRPRARATSVRGAARRPTGPAGPPEGLRPARPLLPAGS